MWKPGGTNGLRAPVAALALLLPAVGSFLVPVSAQAATLGGRVLDLESGEPLPYATVQAAPDPAGFRAGLPRANRPVGDRQAPRDLPDPRGTAADDTGSFRFLDLEPGRWIVRASFIGYESTVDTVAVTEASPTEITLRLRPTGFTVETVEVVGDRIEDEPVEDARSSVNLTGDELAALPAFGEPDPIRTLQLLPGVQAASDISSGLYVRGGGPDQNLVLLDRVTIYNPTHAFGLFSSFNSDAVEDVTLYKGAYPAEYTGRLGSVLDVRNRAGRRGGVGGRGGISTISGRMLLEGPLPTGSWMVSARRTYLEPILGALRDSDPDIPSYYFYDLNGTANVTVGDAGILRANVYSSDDDLDFDLTSETRLQFEWGNRIGSLEYTHLLGDEASLRVLGSASQYESTIDVEFFSTPVDVDNRIREWTLRSDLTWQAGEQHRLQAGISGSIYDVLYRQDFNANVTLDLEGDPFDLSLFAEDEWRSEREHTVVRGGLRARYFSDGDRVLWEPRLFLNQRLTERWRLRAGGGVYHQYLQLVTTEGFSAGDFYVPVDESTRPGRSVQAVLGAVFAPNEAYEFTAEAYYTDLARLLVLDNNAPPEIEDPTTDALFLTGGTGYATGLELFAQKRTGRLRGWVGYTLGWTRRSFDELNGGREFPPKYDRRHDLNVAGTYRAGKWTFGAVVVYGSGQAFTSAISRYGLRDPALDTIEGDGYVLAGDRNNARLLPYHRMDLNVAREFGLFGLDAQWVVQVFNVYSRRNEWFVQFDGDEPGNPPEIVRQLPVIPSIGINFAF